MYFSSLPGILQSVFRSTYDCSMYPQSTSQRVCMPPDQAYKIKGVTAPSCASPNPSTATISTTGSPVRTNSATGLAMGSILFYLISIIINYFF